MKNPNWELLNAYVDGELTTEETLQVSEAMARDGEIASQVATLMRLKVCVNTPPEQLRPLQLADNSGNIAQTQRSLLSCACVLILLLGSALFSQMAYTPSVSSPEIRLLAEANNRHKQWIEDTRSSNESARLQERLSSISIDTSFVSVLSEVDLQLVRVEPWPTPTSAAVHLGYAGPKDCRVSLFVRPHNVAIEIKAHKQDKAWVWAYKDFAYIALADKMDPDRFAGIATWLQTITYRWQPMNAQQQSELLASRALATPCG